MAWWRRFFAMELQSTGQIAATVAAVVVFAALAIVTDDRGVRVAATLGVALNIAALAWTAYKRRAR